MEQRNNTSQGSRTKYAEGSWKFAILGSAFFRKMGAGLVHATNISEYM